MQRCSAPVRHRRKEKPFLEHFLPVLSRSKQKQALNSRLLGFRRLERSFATTRVAAWLSRGAVSETRVSAFHVSGRVTALQAADIGVYCGDGSGSTRMTRVRGGTYTLCSAARTLALFCSSSARSLPQRRRRRSSAIGLARERSKRAINRRDLEMAKFADLIGPCILESGFCRHARCHQCHLQGPLLGARKLLAGRSGESIKETIYIMCNGVR